MKDIDDFESKFTQAKQIIVKLNDADISLGDSVKLYRQGLNALKEASDLLEKAKLIFEEKSEKVQ